LRWRWSRACLNKITLAGLVALPSGEAVAQEACI